ncbi:glycosyltransferase family 1 protein [Gottschalkiaceae bacterium SANA]|nr:glycosyltransferase family 1 protein [Gottschalkiaceae bacterium SANA]
MKKDVIFFGCRGYSQGYGGWETLVRNVIDNWQHPDVHFYVFELVHNKNEAGEFIVNGVTCIRIFIPSKNHFEMIFCDFKALKMLKKLKEKYGFENPILYVMGARIGSLFWLKRNQIKKMGYILVHNPAGLEWKRESNPLIALYVYISHLMLANACRYIICDCFAMQEVYTKICPKKKDNMSSIHYGTYEQIPDDYIMNNKARQYFASHGIVSGKYYLIINRFVRENSYELILSEFVKSKTDADFIVVSNIERENKIYAEIAKTVPFEKDERIKFVGTVYDKDILKVLRSNSRGYINGHTLGGTNPGLLESLSTTNVNLVRDCVFSREGAADTAIYFDENNHPLHELLLQCDAMNEEQRKKLGAKAKIRMRKYFNWKLIAERYNDTFCMLFSRYPN